MANSPEFESTQMKKNQMCRTYLITYSRADLELFPNRESFGLAIAEAFDLGTSKVKVGYCLLPWKTIKMVGSTIM